MVGKVITLITLAAAIVLLFLLQSTNPTVSGPLGILAVFLSFYIVCFGCLTRIIHTGSWLLSKAVKPVRLKRPLRAMSLPHAAYYSSIIAMAPIMLMAIGSVGRAGFYEVLLVIAFVVLGVFYVRRRLA